MEQKKRITVEIIIGLVLILGFYFSFRAKEKSIWPGAHIEADGGYREVMGTFARIVAVAADSSTAMECVEAAFSEIVKIDELMSDYKSDSEISKVNRDGFKQPVEVSGPTFEVLQRSVEFSQLTSGTFDITVGPLVDLFRSAEKKGVAPTEDAIAQARLKVGFEKLQLNEQNKTVKFAVEGMRLDLGGIAKGYAVDLAVEAMQEMGAIGGMVDIGGDIRCFGAPPRGKEHWLIGLQDPDKTKDVIAPTEPLLVLKLTNAAVATSGDYRRFTLIEDIKYGHIIDAKTGRSSDRLTSVTIICKKSIDADALATAVSVMGAEKGLALIEKTPETEAILIPPLAGTTSGPKHKLIKTPGAEKYISR